MSGAPAEFALDQPPSDGISQVVWANSSDLLLASSWDRTLRLYDVTHNVCRLQVEHAGAVLDCCFDANDTRAFAVGMDQHVTAVDLATGARNVLGSHSGVSRCVVSHVESQSLFSGGWDGRLLGWDARQSKQTASTTPQEGERVLTLALSGNRLVVGTSKRHVLIYDLRNLSTPEQRRESSLMNQTRCIRGFPDTTGYALSSIEGRVAIEYFNPEPAVQKNKYAFKCHRKSEGTKQVLYPVNALAFHPRYGTFATGGCDGLVNVWDGANKKRICQYPAYPTSIAALNFNHTGDKLAVAASYTWEEGEKDHPNDAIYIRTVNQHEVLPKQRQAGIVSAAATTVKK